MPNNVKNTTFLGPLDLLFPHSCRGCGRLGAPLCDCCKKYILQSHADVCPNCKGPQEPRNCSNCKDPRVHGHCPNCPDLPPIYVVASKNTLLGDIIKAYKYDSIRALARPLAELLAEILPPDLPKNSVIIPLPTATHHLRNRGFDHVKLIATHLGRLRHLPVKPLLRRQKNTVQVGSDRSTRLTQADSAYALNPKAAIDPATTYLILDDIWTTGASVLSAVQKLKAAGGKHFIVALLAYSGDPTVTQPETSPKPTPPDPTA